MSWRIDDHPEGGLQITHLVAPRFTARWTTGAFPVDQIKDGEFFWTDEGSGEDDAIYFYDFAWVDSSPIQSTFGGFMFGAVKVIERQITDGL